jgi:hypothetical protein
MLETVELPASIPDLDPSLAYVNTDDLSHDANPSTGIDERCSYLVRIGRGRAAD